MLFLFHAHVVVFGDMHLARFNLGDLGIADPLDVLVAYAVFDNALGVAHSTQAKVADVWFGSDEGHRYLVAYFAFAQIGIHDEGVFVSRAEAGCALHCTDHDGSWICAKMFPFIMRLHRMVDMTDRMGVAAVRAESLA